MLCILLAAGPISRGFAATAELDQFGIQKLHGTAKGGREWFSEWQTPRSIAPSRFDPRDPLFRNSDGTLKIKDGVASITPGQTRLFILTPKDQAGRYTVPQWKNVEMTIYVKSGAPVKPVSAQALDFAARSGERHSANAPCEGTSYHASLRFDGKAGFKKEVWHTGGYTDLRPNPAPAFKVPTARWFGMKFVCRNSSRDRQVRLQLYVDLHERNEWKLIAEMTDSGRWAGKEQNCNRPKDYIIAEARPAVYFRTDFVPVELKKFSVREIDPLP